MKKSIKEFKKTWFSNKTRTFMLAIILILFYLSINMLVKIIPYPIQIDLTENKLYSLTEASKKAISNVDEKVTVYLWGYSDK